MSNQAQTVDVVDVVPAGRPRSINPVEVLELREKGLSFAQIGKILGCTKQAAHKAFQHVKTDFRGVEKFKDIRADIFALFQKKLLYSLTAGEIKSMAPASRITAAAILYDKERLERDKSTSNISYQAIVSNVADLERRESELKAQIAELSG